MAVDDAIEIAAADRIADPNLRRLLEHWAALAPDGAIPREAKFHVSALPAEVADRTFVVDVLPGHGNYRLRSLGRYLVDAYGRDFTGCRLVESEIPRIGQSWTLRMLDRVVRERRPLHSSGPTAFRFTLIYSNQEQVLLPLADQTGRIVAAVGAVDFPEFTRAIRAQPEFARADAAARRGDTRYRALVEFLPQAVLVLAAGKIVTANQAACRLLGAGTIADLIGLDVFDFVPPEHRAEARARYALRMSGAPPVEPPADRPFLRLDGSTFIGEFNGAALPESGEFIVTLRDVSEERRSSRRLAEAEARLRDALESMSDRVFIWDSSDRLVMASRGGEAWAAFSREMPAPGIGFRDLIRLRAAQGHVPRPKAGFEAFTAGRVRQHEAATGEPEERQFADGTWIEYRDRRTKEGGIVTVLRHVTERRRREAAREAELRALEAVATDAPLADVLAMLCAASEAQLPKHLCSMQLANREGTHLIPAAAPSLPEAFCDPANAVAIGPAAGSCGTAAYRRERVVVADILTDPLWRSAGMQARAHGLRSCWSAPLFGSGGRVIGTFALYGRAPEPPSDQEIAATEHLRRIAEIAIERRNAGDELRETAARLAAANERFAIAGTQAGIWDWDIAAGSHFFSLRVAEMLGFDEAGLREHTREGLAPLVHPDDGDSFKAGLGEQLARAPGPYAQVVRVARKDGGYAWISLSGQIAVGDDGRPARLAALVSDVSDLKRAEEAVRHSEERFRTLLEFLPTAVMTFKGGVVTSANAEACRLFGVSDSEDLRGLNREGLVHPDERAASAARTEHVYTVGGTLPFVDRRYVARDGREFIGEVGATVIRRDDGDEALIAIRDVTELRAMGERAKAAEARLRDAIDSLADGFLLWDRDDRLVLMNETHLAQERGMVAPILALGGGYEEMLRERIFRGLVPGAAGTEESYIRERIHRRLHPTDEPFEVQVADGRWFELRDRRTAEGGIVSVRRDITAQKRVQVLLEVERRILELVATDAPLPDTLAALCRAGESNAPHLRFAVCLVDQNERVLRHGAAPSLPANFIQAIDGLEVSPTSPGCGAAAFLGEPVGSSDIVGDPRWAGHREVALASGIRACWSMPMSSARGRVLGALAVYDGVARAPSAQDLELVRHLAQIAAIAVERLRAQDALRESRERLDAIMEHTIDGLLVIDERGTVENFNTPAARIFGYATEEVVGRNVSMLMPEPHRSLHDRYIAEYVRTGIGQVIGTGREVEGLRRDGTTFPMDLAIGEIALAGRGRRFVGTVRDVTERKATEAQLRQAQKLQALGQLTGGVAHDFNNLLAVVRSNVELVIDHAQIDADARRSLDAVLRATTRGAELTGRLLAFASRQPLSPKRTDVNRLVRDLAQLLARTLGETVRIEIDLAADLDAAIVDPGQLQNALVNLAVNARDAMPGGGVVAIATRNVALGAEADDATGPGVGAAPGRYVRIAVRDSGTGMPPEVAARAFEPFFTTKQAGKGSGLGLSMVYGFAKQSGGRVTLDTAPGRGTTLCLDLPAAYGAAVADAGAIGAGPAAGGGGTVLLVEDDADVRDTVARHLGVLGYRVRTAADGAEALVVLASSEPCDVVLSDVVLPGGMSGVDIVERARALRPGLRFVFMSGYTDSAANDARIRAIGARLLMKPFGGGELARAIAEA